MSDQQKEALSCFAFLFDNAEDSYARQRIQSLLDYVRELQNCIDEKDRELTELRADLFSPTRNRNTSNNPPMEFPTPRGTTHGQLMQMQHEAETMHDNPPHGQPMG